MRIKACWQKRLPRKIERVNYGKILPGGIFFSTMCTAAFYTCFLTKKGKRESWLVALNRRIEKNKKR